MAVPADRVWSVLRAFHHYPAWNPFITQAKGDLKVGSRLTVRIEPPGMPPRTFHPVILNREPNREIRWRGSLPIPGLFSGEHVFQVKSTGELRTKLLHFEIFRGLLVPLLWKKMEEPTRQGFELMNQALKKRCEFDAEYD